MYQKILFPTDGSETSKKALSQVIDMATNFNAEVVVLHIYQVPVELGHRDISFVTSTTYYVEFKDHLVKYANFHVNEVKEELAKKDIKVTALLKEGKPGPAIMEVAEEEKCDLIIMGSRGLGAIKGILLGSISNYVVCHAKVPTLLVH